MTMNRDGLMKPEGQARAPTLGQDMGYQRDFQLWQIAQAATPDANADNYRTIAACELQDRVADLEKALRVCSLLAGESSSCDDALRRLDEIGCVCNAILPRDAECAEEVARLEAEYERKLADDERAFEEQYAAEHPDEDYFGRPV